MSFIGKQEIKNSIQSPLLSNDFSIKIMSGILGWTKANRFYNKVKSYNIKQFIQAYKRKSKITHIVPQDHLSRIPTTGSLLIIANHPTGIPDGILILDQVLKVRKDVKIIANQLTYKVDPLKPYTIPVDPYDKSESVRQNALQLRVIFEWLEEGHCVILFPSGDVANYNFKEKHSDEQFWHPTAKKIILKHKGLVLPWAIQGKNSHLFYQLGKVHPSIKSALLPREGLKTRRKPIFSHIGFPIKIDGKISLLNDLETKIRLMSMIKHDKNSSIRPFFYQHEHALVEPVSSLKEKEKIIFEIERSKEILAEKGSLKVILTNKKESPETLFEVGRLREITFRKIGEGTGKQIDLDAHDDVFEHLILWDKELQEIVGSYRMGNGVLLSKIPNYESIIFEFYKKNQVSQKIVNESLILGRAFICESHQQKPFSLFLLWQGIHKYVAKNQDLKYILGQTSIPNTFHGFSTKLIVGFLTQKHLEQNFAKFFIPYHSFKSEKLFMIDQFLSTLYPRDFKRLDEMVQNIEISGNKIPILFKRYVEQNAEVLGVNIDPAFQNSIDVLMLTKIER